MNHLPLHILRILAGAPASGVIVTALRLEAGLRAGGRVGEVAFSEAVAKLKEKGWVVDGERDELTDDPVLKLTAKGRKEAARR